MTNKLMFLLTLISGSSTSASILENWASHKVAQNAKMEAEVVPRSFHHFERIVTKTCLRCHSGREPKGGLELSSRNGLMRGGDSGPAIDLQDPESSLLLRRVIEGSMPPIGDGEPIPPADIDSLRHWIQFGAPWPSEQPALDLHPLDVKEHACVNYQPTLGRPCASYRRGVIRRRLRTRTN